MHLNKTHIAAALMLSLCSHAVIAETSAAMLPQQVATKGKTIKATGTVLDAAGEPVIGANVVVEGTTIGTITDMDGKYELEVPQGSSLTISYIGFSPKTIKATTQAITVKLAEDSQLLNEVVVVGYGTMKKTDLTGAVASIKASDMEKEQRQTLQDMLRQGVAGLSVGIETDTKGNTDMMIRGKSTIGASTDPLIVLDGVIYPGEMTDINPQDVERIDVLKDASSAAVYGAQAANGVILVTTKKGNNSGKPTVSFNASVGAAFTNSVPKVYKGMDFINFRRDVEKSINSRDSDPGNYYDNPSNLNNTELAEWMGSATGDPMAEWLNRLEFNQIEIDNFLAGNEVDWEDMIYQKAALRQDYTVSISGKKDDMSYYSSLNYLKNENNVIGGGFSAIRARVNLENKVGGFLTYGVNTQFTARDEGYISRDNNYTTLSPYGSVYEEDGVTPKYYPNDNNNATNPLTSQTYTDKMKKIYNMNSSLYLKVELPFGFSLQTTYSPRMEWINDYQQRSADHPAYKDEGGYAKRVDSTLFYWQWDNMLKWNYTFADMHTFDVTLLYSAEKYQLWNTISENSGFIPSGVLGFHNLAAGVTPVVSSNDEMQTGNALMARLNYSLMDRYLLTASVRRDGFSAFGVNNPYGTYPAFALGWRITEENFMKKVKFVDNLKLRFSWGENGNRDIGRYAALSKLVVTDAIQNGSHIIGVWTDNLANNDLKWERTQAVNLGLDFGLFNGRLNGVLDLYHNKTTDLIVKRSLPTITGYESVVDNLGQVNNKGIELTLTSTNIYIPKKVNWSTTFIYSANKNTIKHLYGKMVDVLDANGNVIGQREDDDVQNGWYIGHGIKDIYYYKMIGIWQLGEEEEAAKYGKQPGDPKLLDVDNDGVITEDDKVWLGSRTPRYRMSLRSDLRLFDCIDFSFVLRGEFNYWGEDNLARNEDNRFFDRSNSIWNEYWTPWNPSNEYARLGANCGNPSVLIFKKRDFVRMQNMSLSYTFPKAFLKKFAIENLKISLSVDNAFVITGWDYYDPENMGTSPRIWTFGVNVTL